SGRPGPVVISLPEDMLADEVETLAPLPFTPVETRPGAAEIEALAALLRQAERPFVILGGTRWTEDAVRKMCAALERWALPAGCSFRRQMLCDQLHPSYAGDIGLGINPELSGYIMDADLVLLVGGRFSESPSSNYTLLKSPYPEQKLVHVHPDPQELGRVYRPTIAINATPAAFADAFATTAPATTPVWANRTEELHRAYLDWSTPPSTGPGKVLMGPIMAHLETVLPQDAIIC